MDVQNPLTLFSRLNDALSPLGSTPGPSGLERLSRAGAAPAAVAGSAQDALQGPSFANLLDQSIRSRPETAPPEPTRDSEIRQKAQIIVNQFFVGTMLKQMRQSPFKDEMFSGGKGGQAYQGMFDRQIAERAGNRIAKTLVDSLVKSYRKHGADPKQLFIDPVQQKQFEAYQKSQTQRASHDSATAISA